MKSVDWSYHRNNCMSCSRAAAFLEERGTKILSQVDARKTPLVPEDVIKLVGNIREIYVTRGSKVFHFNLIHERPSDESLLELLIGRSGKLRAPALRVGNTLIVGFDHATYDGIFR